MGYFVLPLRSSWMTFSVPASACGEFIIINLLLVLSFCTIKFLTTFLKMLLILRLGAADPKVNIFLSSHGLTYLLARRDTIILYNLENAQFG